MTAAEIKDNKALITYKAVKLLQLKTKKPESEWTENVSFHCPLHNDKTPSMFIHMGKGIVHCFSCGFSGSIFQLYFKVVGKSLSHDLNITIDEFSFFCHDSEPELPPEERFKLRENISIKVIGEQKPVRDVPTVVKYFRQRGISFSIADQMRMKFMSKGVINEVLFYNRLLIPIIENGKTISIEGRDITRKQKRKVLYPKSSTVNSLYDIDVLDKRKTLYVVEGLIDLAILRSDDYFKNSTCIFGAGITERQIWMLEQFDDVVYIPDNDDAGLQTLAKLKMNMKKPFSILKPPLVVKDVGDITEKTKYTIKQLRERGWLDTIVKSNDFRIFY